MTQIFIDVIHDTTIKQSTAQAATLPANAFAYIKKGRYPITKYSLTPKQGHWQIAFADPVISFDGTKSYYTWLVWGDDLGDFIQDGKVIPRSSDITLPVPFFSQLATKIEPSRQSAWEQDRTCNSSACAMVARYLGAKIKGDDDYYFNYLQREGDSTDHAAQGRALKRLGIKSNWYTNLGFTDLDKSLAKGFPVVMGILHRGPLSAPRGGHMIVCIGKRGSDYLFNDPYGSLVDKNGGYTGGVEAGSGVVYSRTILLHRWLPEHSHSGWGRLFY